MSSLEERLRHEETPTGSFGGKRPEKPRGVGKAQAAANRAALEDAIYKRRRQPAHADAA